MSALTGVEVAPIAGRAAPVAGSTNDTAPVCEPIAIVSPSGLIAAADGAGGPGEIATVLSRVSERASNALTLCASTTSRRVPASTSAAASTVPESIRTVARRRPLGSNQRYAYVAPKFPGPSPFVEYRIERCTQ